MMKIAIFASGSGSNFAAICKAVEGGVLEAEIALLVCDRPGALVIEKAKQFNIDTFVFQPKNYDSKVAFERDILKELEIRQVIGIVLAGYMRLIGEVLLRNYEGRMINLHPSILPSFPGKDAIGQAWRGGVKVTGITIHFVDEGMDTGPIIAQKPYEIKENDNIETLTKAIHEIEHEWYPKIIQKVITENWGREES